MLGVEFTRTSVETNALAQFCAKWIQESHLDAKSVSRLETPVLLTTWRLITYVCAWTAMLRSRGMGSNELEKRSCMYSWKSTPLAEPVLS